MTSRSASASGAGSSRKIPISMNGLSSYSMVPMYQSTIGEARDLDSRPRRLNAGPPAQSVASAGRCGRGRGAARVGRRRAATLAGGGDGAAVRAEGGVAEEGADLVLEAGGDRRGAAALGVDGSRGEGAGQEGFGEPHPAHGGAGQGAAAVGEGDPAV